MFQSINPFTQELLVSFPKATDEAVEQALNQASSAFKKWKNIPIQQRAEKVMLLGAKIKEKHMELARLATLEMGKPYSEAKIEVLKCITACEYYAQQGASILTAKKSVHTDGRTVIEQYEPLGTVLGVFPWNFPYWQIIRSAIPVIMGGNTMIVKPSPNVPQSALALQAIIDEVGLGNGVIQTVFADEMQIASMIADYRIHACTLTGSERAGAAVASQAAKQIKKSVLELGGSDPFIVLEDADLSLVAKHAISARFQNNGQSCIASKRYIVHQSIAERFLADLIEQVKQLQLGNPLYDGVQIGPLARLDLKQKLANQVEESVKAGATILYQSDFNHENTCFYPPTVLGNIPSNSVAYREELFGPVLSVYIVESTDDAIRIANDTEFGLGASVWSSNIDGALKVAEQLETGQVFINAVTRSHTAFPFGGVKKSGFGRELGPNGLLEFCAIKSVWV